MADPAPGRIARGEPPGAQCRWCDRDHVVLFRYLDRQGRKAFVMVCPSCDQIERRGPVKHGI